MKNTKILNKVLLEFSLVASMLSASLPASAMCWGEDVAKSEKSGAVTQARREGLELDRMRKEAQKKWDREQALDREINLVLYPGPEPEPQWLEMVWCCIKTRVAPKRIQTKQDQLNQDRMEQQGDLVRNTLMELDLQESDIADPRVQKLQKRAFRRIRALDSLIDARIQDQERVLAQALAKAKESPNAQPSEAPMPRTISNGQSPVPSLNKIQ